MIKLPDDVPDMLNLTPEQQTEFNAGFWYAVEKIKRLNATAQPVSDDKSSLLTYLNECSEQVSRWPEWKKKGSDVAKIIKEMDDFELGFVNGWSERHKQPVSDGWVKCSDRMPEHGTSVIVWDDEVLTGESTGDATDYGLGIFWVKDHQEGFSVKAYVTHWMPLPAAPGGQGD